MIIPLSFGRSNPAIIFVQNYQQGDRLFIRNIRRGHDSNDNDSLKQKEGTVAVWHVKYFGKEKRHNK